MKKNLVILSMIIISTSLLIQAVPEQRMQGIKKSSPAAVSSQWKVDLNYGKIPLYFIPNKGQVHKKAIFYAKTSRYILWMTKEGLVFDSIKRERVKGEKEFSKRPGKFRDRKNEKIYRDVSRILFLNAKKNPEIVPLNKTEHVVSYFTCKDPSKWKTGIHTSKAVLYKSLYKNIDLKIYGVEKQIEYDWIVKPGGNPAHIRFEYKSVKRTRIDEKGNLLIETQFGEWVHRKPISYQEINRKRISVDVTFKKIYKNTYGFIVGAYNKNYKLIIDPVILAYSTYLGGTFNDYGNGIAIDNNGLVYVVGETYSRDFPTGNCILTTEYSGCVWHGSSDAFITKFSASGSSIIYSSYIGGGGSDCATAIAIDNNDRAYITGYTGSSNFPIVNGYDDSQNGIVFDIFIVRLSSAGTTIQYSTYLGGSISQFGNDIAVDGSQNVYIAGYSMSTDFPFRNGYQTVSSTSNFGVVAKIDTDISGDSSLIFSSSLTSPTTPDTVNSICESIAVDSAGSAYVTGYTNGDDFPTTVGAFQTSKSTISSDAFVTKFSPDGSSLIYSTYLGGDGEDKGFGIDLDNSNNAYITGFTISDNFPTQNPYQASRVLDDAFLSKLSADGSSLSYSTYLGGTKDDVGSDIAVTSSGEAIVVGPTDSDDFPIINPIQGSRFGRLEVFITKFSSTGNSLEISTYLGGSKDDEVTAVDVNLAGYVCITGLTLSNDFPVYKSYQNYEDIDFPSAFVVKFDSFDGSGDPFIIVTSPSGGEVWDTGSTHNITWGSSSSVGDVRLELSTDNGNTWSNIIATTDNDGRFEWTVPSIPSAECLVRVSEAADGDPSDVSPSVFTIFEGLALTSPNGNENWEVGSTQNITWESSGNIGDVKLELSTDNGSTWSDIIASTANNGTYLWTVPDSVSSECLVRISEASDGVPQDVSNNTFSIIPEGFASLTITSPNGGESLTGGSTHTITWISTGTIPNVKLEYSTNNGTSWTTITNATANDGSHSWNVPNVTSSQCLVRISDALDGDPVNQSNEVFSISPSGGVPTLTITSPNGGETYWIGISQDITWTSTGRLDNVQIEYSTNNGASWIDVAASTSNDGLYAWSVPDTPSSQCLVRISNVGAGTPVRDVSDNVFTIATPQPSITITSPQGGEYWQVGSIHDITWTTYKTVGNVKIEYSTNNKSTWNTIIASTTNDGSYSWTVPNTPSSSCFVKLSEAADGFPYNINYSAFSIVTGSEGPEIGVNHTALYYGSLKSSSVKTPSQQIIVDNSSGIGTLRWQASDDAPWLILNNTTGIQSGIINASINPMGLAVGTHTGSITIADPNVTNSPQTITVSLTVYPVLSDTGPFGSFDTPVNGSTVMSSVPVTGWVLDDIGVESVALWRDTVQGEGSGQVYIGDAVMVEGARPDIEQTYPSYPVSYKAGWGYMMLTNFLPNGGNGTFKLYAYAKDGSGHDVLLGTKTITCDNAHAVKPFGAIDTPKQGGNANGSNFRNHGWVLTPMPNRIPENGSTIFVYIDGVSLGNPTYNIYREDIAALFPGYANSSGPHAFLDFDTTTYKIGLHTIQWVAADNAGNADGIGSRYFSIQNSGYINQAAASGEKNIQEKEKIRHYHLLSQLTEIPVNKSKTIGLKRGYKKDVKPQRMPVGKNGGIQIELKEDNRIELHLAQSPGYRYSGYLVVGKQLRPIPTGSTLDRKTGVFYWQPGPGYIWKYELLFIAADASGKINKNPVTISITPKFEIKKNF